MVSLFTCQLDGVMHQKSRLWVSNIWMLGMARNKRGFRGTRMGAPKISPIAFDDGAVGLRIVAAMGAGSVEPARPARPRSDPIPILGRARPHVKPKAAEEEEDDDVELSESYTCVITRVGGETVMKRVYLLDDAGDDGGGICGKFEMNSGVFFESPPVAAGPGIRRDFLSCCYLCRKKLHGLDIFMYRGEKAFCSEECRCQQIVKDERKENCRSEARKARGSPLAPRLSPLPFDAGVAAA